MTSGIQAPLPLVLQRVVLRIREHNCVKVNGGYTLRHVDMQSTLHFSWMLGWPGESIAEFALLIHMVPCGFDSRCTEKEKKKKIPLRHWAPLLLHPAGCPHGFLNLQQAATATHPSQAQTDLLGAFKPFFSQSNPALVRAPSPLLVHTEKLLSPCGKLLMRPAACDFLARR